MTAVMDFDDFCDETNELTSLKKLRQANGNGFKVTLFTIPGKSTVDFLKSVKFRFPWIELAIHGWTHTGIGECRNWTKREAIKNICAALQMGVFTKGFKAPHWQTSSGTYDACRDLGLWVSEIYTNKHKIPPGLKTYVLGEPEKNILQVHGHITNSSGNYIKNTLENYILRGKYTYRFISEVAK